MTVETVQVHFSELAAIEARFLSAQERTLDALRTVRQRSDILVQGSWKGKGVTAFSQEMDDSVIPAMQRLAESLASGAQTCKLIVDVMKQAEQIASAPFRVDGEFSVTDSRAQTNSTYLVGFDELRTGEGPIPSLFGPIPSLPTDFFGVSDYLVTHEEIRTWVHQASSYHDVPPQLLAVVLQQENAPDAAGWLRPLQAIERWVTTGASVLESSGMGMVVPDWVSKGSSGIANMQKDTLDGAVAYVESTYGRPVMPDSMKHTALPMVDRDTRIQGLDVRADLYYASAHLRELIDREIGNGQPYTGPLTADDIERVLAAYNGSGAAAEKYGKDAMRRLEDARSGEVPLYFL